MKTGVAGGRLGVGRAKDQFQVASKGTCMLKQVQHDGM